MAKPWAEVTSSPQFQQLSPGDQEAARQQYFSEVVAPNVQSDQLPTVRQQFDAATKPGAVNNGPGVLHYIGDVLKGAVDTASAFKGGVNHGASFGLIPQDQTATDHPIAAGAGDIVGSMMSGGALEKAGVAAASKLAPGMVAKISSAMALRPGSPVSNLLKLAGQGAAAGGAQGALSGAVQGAENDGVSGAATGAVAGGGAGAVAGAALGTGAGATAGVGKIVRDGVDSVSGASKRALQLLADKLEMTSPQLQKVFTDFKASTGRNPTVADILDARSKANIQDTLVNSRGHAGQVMMNTAADDNTAALPGRVQNFVTSNGATKTPFDPNNPQPTGEIGNLQAARDNAAHMAMDPIRDMKIPLDTQSKDVLLSQTLPNTPLKQVDKFKINDEIANGHITLGSVDVLRRKLQSVAASDPASAAAVLAADLGDFGRTHSPEYGKMLDDYSAHSRFINGFEHADKGRDISDADLPLRRDLNTDEGRAGLELGARSRMAANAATETGARSAVNKARQDTGFDPNLPGVENGRLQNMAQAEDQSQKNYADLAGRVKSSSEEQGQAVKNAIEGAAALGGHVLTGFKTHFLSRMLTKIGVGQNTSNAFVHLITTRDPTIMNNLPTALQQLRLNNANQRKVLAAVARTLARPTGQLGGDIGGSQ